MSSCWRPMRRCRRSAAATNRAHGGSAVLATDPDAVADFIAGALVLSDDFAPADQLLTGFPS